MENLYHLNCKRPKYGNKKVELDGYSFDSKAEARRYAEIRLLEAGGIVMDVDIHPRFPLVVNGVVVKIRSEGFPNGRQVFVELDFGYTDRATNERIFEDVKGVDTPVSRLKRALLEAIYGVRVRVIKGGRGGKSA